MNEASQAMAEAVPAARSGAPSRACVTALLCTVYALLYLDRVNLSAAAGSIKAGFHMSPMQLGVAFSGFAWAYLLTVFFGGWAAHRYGPKAVLLGCSALLGLATMGMAFANGILSLFLLRMLVGAGEGPAFPAATQAMRRWYPANRFGFIQGITHSASRLGAAVAPPFVAALIVAWNWRASFVICGAAVLVWSVVWWKMFRDDPSEGESANPTRVAAAPRPTMNRSQLRQFVIRMSPVTLVMFCYGWVYWIFVSWLPLFFSHQYHFDLKASALFSSLPLLAGMVGNTVGGMLSDHILKRRSHSRLARCGVVAGSLLGSAMALAPLAAGARIDVALPCLSLAMFCLEMTIAPMYAVPMDMSRDFAGLGSSFIIVGVALAGITSPVVFGWLVGLTGRWDAPFATAIAILLLGSAAVLLIRPDHPLSWSDAP